MMRGERRGNCKVGREESRKKGEWRGDCRVGKLMENEVCQVYTWSETIPIIFTLTFCLMFNSSISPSVTLKP